MRPSTPLDFPGGRHVAGWWKQLTPLRPRALWVAHLLLHRVEALVRTGRPVRPDTLTRLLLEATAPGDSAAGLAARLGVPVRVGVRLLRQLQTDGLVRDGADGRWLLTPLGRQALDEDCYTPPGHERRPFYFAENEAGRPPHFLRLLSPCGTPWAVGADWAFDVGLLRAAVEAPPAWKERHGFPTDVAAVMDGTNGPGTVPPWQTVIVDRSEYLPAALVLAAGDEGERLLGYALEPAGWGLHGSQAAFAVGADWRDVFPDLAVEPTPEQWREAWRGWCQRRGLPTVEADACALARHEQRVRVRVPARLLDRLRAARSEALKGEAWLLAGAGRVRLAGQIDVHT